jgi:hypothetical protein
MQATLGTGSSGLLSLLFFFLKSIYVEAFEMKILTLSDMVPICENLV